MSSTAFYNSQNLVGIGSVGIGTTNPATALDVFTGTMNAATVVATTYYGALAGSNTGTFSNIYSANALTTTNLFANTLVASGQVQSLDSLRGHALPSDAMIVASATQVNPTNQNTGSYAIVESAGATIAASNLNMTAVTQSPFADLYKEGSMYTSNVATSNITAVLGSSYLWTSGLTAECWVNFVNNPTALVNPGGFNIYAPCAMSGTYAATGSVIPWSLGLDTNGKVVFYYYNASGSGVTTSQSANTNISISLNTWNHIAVSVPSGGPISIYINGVQQTIQQNITGSTGSTLAIVGTGYSSQYLSAGGLGGSFMNGYIADYRVTYGAALYTGSSFTVPSAPLGIAGSGTTVALIRAGQNSPTIQNGALTFDRGLKQYMNFGPQTFNIVTQGFTAVWKGAFTGTVASYERIFEFGTGASTGNIVALRSIATGQVWFVVYPSTGGGSSSVTSVASLTQGVTYVLTFRYNPTTQILDIWINGAQNTSATVTTATLIADRTVAFTYLSKAIDTTQNGQFTSNTLAIYNRALSNTEIYNAFLALNTVPATPQQKTLEIGDVNGTPALSVAGNGQVSVQSIGLSSNVVQWPPAAMTGYVTSINGGIYRASSSNDSVTYNFTYSAFDKSNSTYWSPLNGTYTGAVPYSGTVTTTDVNGTQYRGEWLQLQLPSPIFQSYYTIYAASNNNAPTAWSILGSNDGVNWFLVDSRFNISWVAAPTTQTFALTTPSTKSYSYFRMIVNVSGTAAQGAGVYSVVYDLTYYGTADASPSLTIAPATVFNTSVATPSLVGVVNNASYVPQDFSSSGLNIPAYVVSNTATTANTVQYSSLGPFAGEGSLYFPGGTGAYVSFPSSVPSLNYDIFTSDFTIEGWAYNAGRDGNQNTILNRTTPGNYGDWAIFQQGVAINFMINQAVTYINQGSGADAPANQWYHFAVTMASNTIRIFVNGVTGNPSGNAKPTTSYTSTGAVNVGWWTIVSTGKFVGNITNLRITQGQALYTTTFTPPTGPLQPIQGVTQAGLPYGTVLLLRNAPAPGRIQTTKFSGANSGSVLAFPPAAMTGYSSVLNAGYGQGTYVASASSEYPNSSTGQVYALFDKVTTGTNYWQAGNGSGSAGTSYTASSPFNYLGGARTVDVSGTSYAGEWVQIQFPSSVVLSNYQVQLWTVGSSGAPSNWALLGSRDGVNWSLIDQRSGVAYTTSLLTYLTAASQAFTYFRMIITQLSASNINGVVFTELAFNGSIESVNVTPDGRVGLGVVNPTRALEVAGDVVCAGTLSAGNPLMFRNALYNGDMRINQRGISTNWASPTGTIGYTVDRWYASKVAGLAYAQLATGSSDLPFVNDGIVNYMRVGRTAADTTTGPVYFAQALETRESYKFCGKPVTLSMYYRTGSTFSGGTVLASIIWGTGTDNSPLGFTGVTYQNFSLSATTSWTKASFSEIISVNATQVGLNYQYTPSSSASSNDYFDITGVQLEKGSVATPFEIRPYATELALCQRYHYEMKQLGSTGSNIPVGVAWASLTTVARCMIPLPVSMRTAPVLITSTGTGASYGSTLTQPGNTTNDISIYNGTTSIYPTSTAFGDAQTPINNPTQVELVQTFGSASMTQNYAYQAFILNGTTQRFAVTAEL